MARLHESAVALRVSGDELIPAEITLLLGCEPTHSHAKGDTHFGRDGREYARRRSGIWMVSATDSAPESIDEQVADILGRLTADRATWRLLGARFELDLSCGLFMALKNEMGVISARTLKELADRGVALSLDVYAPDEVPAAHDSCPCGSGEIYSNCHGYRGT